MELSIDLIQLCNSSSKFSFSVSRFR